MIENNPTNVVAAFEILMEEIEAEIDFINHLGLKDKNGRLDALLRYKQGFLKRVEFGELNKEHILKHLNNEIRLEELKELKLIKMQGGI
jgi:hypothetical protein